MIVVVAAIVVPIHRNARSPSCRSGRLRRRRRAGGRRGDAATRTDATEGASTRTRKTAPSTTRTRPSRHASRFGTSSGDGGAVGPGVSKRRRRRRRRRTPRNRRRRPCAPSRASRGGARGRGRGARPRRAPGSRPRAGERSRSSAFPGADASSRRTSTTASTRASASSAPPAGLFPSPRCAGERGAGRRRGAPTERKDPRGDARRPRTCAGPRARPLGEHEASGSGPTREARGFLHHDRVAKVQDRRAARNRVSPSTTRSRAGDARGCSGRLGIDRRPGANETTSLLVVAAGGVSRASAPRVSRRALPLARLTSRDLLARIDASPPRPSLVSHARSDLSGSVPSMAGPPMGLEGTSPPRRLDRRRRARRVRRAPASTTTPRSRAPVEPRAPPPAPLPRAPPPLRPRVAAVPATNTRALRGARAAASAAAQQGSLTRPPRGRRGHARGGGGLGADLLSPARAAAARPPTCIRGSARKPSRRSSSPPPRETQAHVQAHRVERRGAIGPRRAAPRPRRAPRGV